MTSLRWLHLTDFHLGMKEHSTLWPNVEQAFFADLKTKLEGQPPLDLVLFTGDLIYQGNTEYFTDLEAWLKKLWAKLAEFGHQPQLLAVPGNHELVRPEEDDPIALALQTNWGNDRVQNAFWNKPDSPYRKFVDNAFAAYSDWWNTTATPKPDNIVSGRLPGEFSVVFHKEGIRFGLVGLNSAYRHFNNDAWENLSLDVRQLNIACGGNGAEWCHANHLNLLLTHHPVSWLSKEAQNGFRKEIHTPPERFALHLCGHLHENELGSHSSGGGQVRTQGQSASLFGFEKQKDGTIERSHGYVIGEISVENKVANYRLWPRKADLKDDQSRLFGRDQSHTTEESTGATKPQPLTLLNPVDHHAPPTPPVVAVAPPPVPSAPPVRSTCRSTLPNRPHFFGRAKELELIADAIHPAARTWGALIDGPGGIGKTALAIRAGQLAPAANFDRKLFLSAKIRELTVSGEKALEDYMLPNFQALLIELGREIGEDALEKLAPNERAKALTRALASLRALLVIDNLETFAPAERDRLYQFLGRLPTTCKAIVTSRRRSDIDARAIRLDRLALAEALDLIADLAQRNPRLAQSSAAERQQLYEITHGNPLLMHWLAGQLGRDGSRCRTIAEACEYLHQAPPDNDPLEYVFGDLLDTFTAAETAVLAVLTFFTEPAKIEWIAELAGLARPAAETALEDLADRALLVADEAGNAYYLPPLAAAFLRNKRPEAVNQSGEQLVRQSLALALENGYDNDERFPTLEAEWPQLAAALPLFLNGDNARLQELCDALSNFLNFSGRWDEWLALSQQAEEKAIAARNKHKAGWRAYHAGAVHFLRGQAAEVLACAARCAAHWQNAGVREKSVAISLRGMAYRLQQDYPAAMTAYREVLKLNRTLAAESENSENLTIALNDLAEVERLAGDHAAAEGDYREALRIAEKIKYREGVANYTGNLAELALDRQDWSGAEELARAALTLSESLGRRELIASHCQWLASALAHQDRPTAGLPYAQRAVEIFSQLRAKALAEAQATLRQCGGDPAQGGADSDPARTAPPPEK